MPWKEEAGARLLPAAEEPHGWHSWWEQLTAAAMLDIGEERERQAQRKGLVRPVPLGRVLDELRQDRSIFAIALGLSLLSSAASQVSPYLTGQLLDALAEKAAFDQCVPLLIGMLLVSLVTGLLGFVQRNMFTFISQSVCKRLRESLHYNVLHMHASVLEQWTLGELLARMHQDSQKLQQALQGQVPRLASQAGTALFAASMMVYINHTLALLGFLTTPVILLVSLRLGRLVKKYSVHVQDLNAETVALATDILTNVRTVQSFGREAAEQQNYVERSTATFNTRRRVVFMMSGTNMLVAQLKSTANLLVLLFAAWLVLVKHPEGGPGPLTVGLLVTFRMYLNTALSNISGLSSAYVAIQQALGGTEKLFELVDLGEEVTRRYLGGEIRGSRCRGEVVFSAVAFAYPSRRDVRVLQSLTFTAKAGATTAFCGPTGSGKSSVLRLLQRFYEPDAGHILLDGADIRRLALGSLRECIASVEQEPILFCRSLADNIRLGRPSSSDEEVRTAAARANAAGFIEELPEQYETLAGERGTSLSGGQKQRIAIARAILKDAPILLLDEATSALDTASEEAVQHALALLMAGRTTLVIAHRLSTIATADTIVVIDRGVVAETGTHDELLAGKGIYHSLVEGSAGTTS